MLVIRSPRAGAQIQAGRDSNRDSPARHFKKHIEPAPNHRTRTGDHWGQVLTYNLLVVAWRKSSRPLRMEIEDGICHVTARGWEQRVLVRDDRDRQEWFKLLERVGVRCEGRFLARVWMDDHVHLFFQTPEANLSVGMHDLNTGYATWFHRRHRRVRSLFQDRCKAILMEHESYGWTLTRCYHLNAVRASVVDRPEAHPWTSSTACGQTTIRRTPKRKGGSGPRSPRALRPHGRTWSRAVYAFPGGSVGGQG